MSSVLFVSDLHLGHRTILKHTANNPGAYRGEGTSVEEHDEWVIGQCLSVGAGKNTVWWILGDVAMNEVSLRHIGRLPGRKRLVMGNHDNLKTGTYLGYFDKIDGMVKKYGMWISHCPMHTKQLYGKGNIHGHVHGHVLRDDPRYFNACIEWLPSNKPISLEDLRESWLTPLTSSNKRVIL